MEVAANRHACAWPQLRPPALARRISVTTQHDPAARRAGIGRHDPVRALCPAAGAHGRQGRAGGAAAARGATSTARGRERGGGARRPASALRRPLPFRQSSAGAQDRARDDPGRGSLYEGGCRPHRQWRTRIEALERPRVAVAWSGSAQHINDRNRSIALFRLAPLWSEASLRFVGIQRELRGEDAELLTREPRVMQIGADLDDFADTAAVVALVDLVITVDTSVAHLAGAMGRPVWILLPFSPDWRWALSGDSSRWYPSARLFRQPALGDWDSVIERLRGELDRFAREG